MVREYVYLLNEKARQSVDALQYATVVVNLSYVVVLQEVTTARLKSW